ncbi:MAG: cupin domain-containing protein [Rhodospirillales bacterium]|nr:cupin domain-containing protein [Rhodospirillales bacterium]
MTDDQKLNLPALDPKSVETKFGSTYPAPFHENVKAREKKVLGDALGLTQFGVNLIRMAPGVMSSQRHWHTHEDEFVYMLEGELILISDEGEQVIGPGMVAGFPAATGNGHHLVNRGQGTAAFLVVGSRDERDDADYPDIDMIVRRKDGARVFLHKDGTPY